MISRGSKVSFSRNLHNNNNLLAALFQRGVAFIERGVVLNERGVALAASLAISERGKPRAGATSVTKCHALVDRALVTR